MAELTAVKNRRMMFITEARREEEAEDRLQRALANAPGGSSELGSSPPSV